MTNNVGQSDSVSAMGSAHNVLGSGLILIVEGVELASTLSQYLSTFFAMRQIPYDGVMPLLEHLENIREEMITRPFILLERLHLTARANKRCTHLGFLEVDTVMKELGARLILTMENDESASSLLMQPFIESVLPKCVFEEKQRITPLLEWIGVPTDAIR